MSGGLGHFGETYAAAHLARLGYRVVDRNVRYRVGELDIVAWDGPVLVFVEVKTRRSSRYGSPEESITAARFRRLALAIETYLAEKGMQHIAHRVDVVAVVLDSSGRVTRCEVLEGVEPPTY